MPATKPTAASPKRRNAIINYLSETIAELKKVTWLNRRDLLYLSGLVILAAAVVGLILGLIDWGFSKFIEVLIEKL